MKPSEILKEMKLPSAGGTSSSRPSWADIKKHIDNAPKPMTGYNRCCGTTPNVSDNSVNCPVCHRYSVGGSPEDAKSKWNSNIRARG